MNTFRIGTPRLRALDQALGGALYEALGVCATLGLAPDLRVGPELDITLVVGSDDGDPRWQWQLPEDDEARRVALDLRITALVESARSRLDRVKHTLDRLDSRCDSLCRVPDVGDA